MAEIYPMVGEKLAAWQEWLADRPEAVRTLALKFPPNKLYRIKSSGHRVCVVSYQEHEADPPSMTVHVTGTYNLLGDSFDREVFGIMPEDLEECDFPVPGELVGSINIARMPFGRRQEIEATAAASKAKDAEKIAAVRRTDKRFEELSDKQLLLLIDEYCPGGHPTGYGWIESFLDWCFKSPFENIKEVE